MSRTVEGGSSPRQNAAIRGRKLIREGLERDRQERQNKKDFDLLRGKTPAKVKLGPLLRS